MEKPRIVGFIGRGSSQRSFFVRGLFPDIIVVGDLFEEKRKGLLKEFILAQKDRYIASRENTIPEIVPDFLSRRERKNAPKTLFVKGKPANTVFGGKVSKLNPKMP